MLTCQLEVVWINSNSKLPPVFASGKRAICYYISFKTLLNSQHSLNTFFFLFLSPKAREIFANISSQIVTYFKSRGIVPNLPTKMNIKQPWDECGNNAPDLLPSRPSSPRMRKITQQVAARCPTCGSVIEHDGFDNLSLT